MLKALNHSFFLFVVWLVYTIFATAYFIGEKLVDFDPEDKLLNVNEQKIITTLKDNDVISKDAQNMVIHFIQKGCSCSANSEKHKLEITNTSQAAGFQVLHVSVTKDISAIIPSVPSTVIIGQETELVYLGPYAIGIDCASSASLVQIVFNNYIKGYNSNLIMRQVKGCFCNV